jgi:ornithine carbamoyltransferase
MKRLLDISDLTKDDFDNILTYSKNLSIQNNKVLQDKSLGLIFEKYSTRTRISFQTGIYQLGGNPIDIKFSELNMQRDETFEDTFEIFGCYLDAIVYRTDNHLKLINASNFFKKPIINALSDKSHPCQTISDIFTLKEHFNKFENLTISWFGDVNNIVFSLVEALNLFKDIKLNIFTHEDIFNNSFLSVNKNENIRTYFDLDAELIKKSDCVMTDVFNSMNDIESIDKEKKLIKFQVNKSLMDLTKPECVFMHCLPANIGSEVTSEVIKSQKSIVIEQARNRLIAQKGILKWLNI